MVSLALSSRMKDCRESVPRRHCAGTVSHAFYLSVASKQSAQGDGAACTAKTRPCERKIQLSERSEFWIFLNGFRLVEEYFSCFRRGSRLRLQTDRDGRPAVGDSISSYFLSRPGTAAAAGRGPPAVPGRGGSPPPARRRRSSPRGEAARASRCP